MVAKIKKALQKLMNNAVYEKTMEKIVNRIHVKLVGNKKDYLKWTSKPRYMPRKTCRQRFSHNT